MKFGPGWRVDEKAQRAELRLRVPDFLAALDLFREVGEAAEALEHHPDLHLESYDRVRVVTWSHDVGRLTERDERLAARVDDIVRSRGLTPGD